MGLPDVTQRKKKRDTSDDANSQTGASNLASLNNDLRSDPMSSAHKTNGHTPESTTRQDIATFENLAASDDAGGQLVAETAASAAACANRDAYAEMAPADAKGKPPLHGRRDQPRQYRPRVGESIVGGSQTARRIRSHRSVRPARLRFHSCSAR
jgi:hypothetical protein